MTVANTGAAANRGTEDFRSLGQWLAYCEHLHTQEIELGLARSQKVRQVLGLEFECPVFVVAGTNGKGSTCAMLESILMAAGYRVGVYSSPHLVHFEERCRVNRQNVTADELMSHFAAVEAARHKAGGGDGSGSNNDGTAISLSYFEFTTLTIMRCMSQQGLDVAVLEVGLGGRLDTVNIIDSDCAIITCIGIDHTDYLGSDRESIGWEKAGIMRSHKPVVVSEPDPPARVLAYAQEVQADLRLLGRDYRYTVREGANADANGWSWFGSVGRLENLAYPALSGSNQLLNGSGVLAALEALRDKLPVTEQHIRQGLAQVALPGRFQIFSLPDLPVVVLDVGHNPHAAAALVENLRLMNGKEGKGLRTYPRTHAIFGAMHDKDVRGVLQCMQPVVDSWYFVDLPTPRAMPGADLNALWKSLPDTQQIPSRFGKNPADALMQLLKEVDPADRIVVFGSFYMVGGILESEAWHTLTGQMK